MENNHLTIIVKIAPTSPTYILAHELRHGMQFQVMGIEAFDAIYMVETEMEGYINNILEEDARSVEDRWTF